MTDTAPLPGSPTRAAYTAGLRELADFLDATPDAPLPAGPLSRHYNDADEYDRAAATLGGTTITHGRYEHCVRSFGVVAYDVQTDGREAQRVRERERRVAAREAELGLTVEPAEATP